MSGAGKQMIEGIKQAAKFVQCSHDWINDRHSHFIALHEARQRDCSKCGVMTTYYVTLEAED